MAKKYKTEVILKSKKFAGYQKDFLKVLLTKDEYTIAEAQKIAEAFFKGGSNYGRRKLD